MKKYKKKISFLTNGKDLFILSTLLVVTSYSNLFSNDFSTYNEWLNNSLFPKVSHSLQIPFKEKLRKNLHLNKKEYILLNKALSLIKDRDFTFPEKYFDKDRLKRRTLYAKNFKAKNSDLLNRIEKEYAVSANTILAIWAIESDFGRAKLPFSSLKVLAYQIFVSNRSTYFYNELLELINILQKGSISFSEAKSSSLGALGQPQFMPSSFSNFAVDSDLDGKIDIWTNTEDTLASIANLLNKSGWVKDLDWGQEVITPPDFPCFFEGPDNNTKSSIWYESGVRKIKKVQSTNFLKDTKTSLLLPKGEYGPKFLVTRNFYTLKTYNNSDLYALYVAHLSDLIDGKVQNFTTPWKDSAPLDKKSIFILQKKLMANGYNVGGYDGLIGHKTRRSLGLWQKTSGQKITCFPN